MHLKIRDKKIFHSMISFILCVVIMLSVVPFSLRVLAVPTAKDQEWIEKANDVIEALTTDDWTSYLTSKFYEAAPFASDNTGTLNWSSVSLSAEQVWDGTIASAPLPTVSGGQITFDGSIYTYNSTGYPSEFEAQQAAAAANPGMIPPLAAGTTYYVYSPQQLLYAFRTLNNGSNNTNYTVKIMQDLDMNGMNHRWPAGDTGNSAPITLEDYTTIDGNGCTIYNLGMLSDVAYTAMISQCTALKAMNLTFRNANICNQASGAANTAVFIARPSPASTLALANYWELDTISFKDCTVVSRNGETGTLFGRFQCSYNNNYANTGATIQNCNIQDSLVTGYSHVGSLTGPILRFGTADKCFSVGCTIISYGKHSGGLFSCMGGMDRCSRCFVDAQVFGSEQTGVFTGNTDRVTSFFDCYSSGFIEGKISLGGFNGSLNTDKTTTTYFNCYSTALVGLRSEGTGLGGFFGSASLVYGAQAFVNCYAAGEVGSADTKSTGAQVNTGATSTNGFVGGFAGQVRLPLNGNGPANNKVATVLAYCYYDKQTTAMREWDLGNYTLAIPTTRTSTSITNLMEGALGITNGCQGLRGVLTTDTTKAGAGLTGAPTSGDGFTGFANLSSLYTSKGIEYQPGWDYSTANHYPELSCMVNASAAEWGEEYYRLVQDYSKASTSTVLLETWEKSLNTETGILEKDLTVPDTTYDTVRDLTIRFSMTGIQNDAPSSAKEPLWARTATASGEIGVDINNVPDPNKNGAKVTLLDKEFDVLQLAKENTDTDSRYQADQFVPGLEWLIVKYGDAVRRLRVMPTVGIEAGAGKTIYCPPDEAPWDVKEPAFYDHADGVELYYSTAARLASDQMDDITTGIFPDAAGTGAPNGNFRYANKFSERQQKLANNGNTMTDSVITAVSNYFINKDTNDKFTDVNLNFMARPRTDSIYTEANQDQTCTAYGSALYVYGRIITAINSTTGEITVSEEEKEDFTDTNVRQVYNGYKLSNHEDKMVMLEYMWQLNDGRVVNDAKVLVIKATPFETIITAYDAGGLSKPDITLKDSDDMLVNMQVVPLADKLNPAVETEDAYYHRTEDYLYASYKDDNGDDLPDNKVGPEYGEGLVASWQVTNPMRVVTKITLKMDSGRKDENGKEVFFTDTIINPKAGDTFTINYEYYQVIAQKNGKFFVSIERKDRVYTIQEADGIFYLVFNLSNEDQTIGTSVVDEFDVANHIYVDLELSAIMSVEKFVTGDYADENQPFDFKITLNDNIDGTPLSYKYFIRDIGTAMPTPGEGGYDTITDNTEKTLTLKTKQEIVIFGLPYGTTYSITEDDYSDMRYLTTADGKAGRELLNKTIDVDDNMTDDKADKTHTFYNDKSSVPPTGLSFDIRWVYLLLQPAFIVITVIIIAKYKSNKYRV